ncbi:MAG TPA: hypothetical protein VM434_17390 [Beijerinckiaceae bacterium]|nr:hypothetical protein [Beijerinckiaceae bacterium]
MRTFLFPSAAAALALGLAAIGPAAAKPLNSCQVRHSYCVERCVYKEDSQGQVNACIQRTCDHQLKSCTPTSTGSGKDGGRGRTVRDKRAPRLEGAPRTGPVAQPLRPRPIPAATGGTARERIPAIRDHRPQRSGPRWGMR